MQKNLALTALGTNFVTKKLWMLSMTDKYMGSLDKTIYNNMDIELDEKK